MNTKSSAYLPGLLAALLIFDLAGCDKLSIGDKPLVVPEGMQICFQCNGTGKMKCPVCRDGEADCPGNCLKLSRGEWIHMQVAGHADTDVWQKFELPDGSGWRAYNQGHLGHVIALRNGDWVDTGVCPICHGTGKIKCLACGGSGEVVCTICDGKKFVPKTWTAFDNPKMKERPARFHMKDGRILIGRKVIEIGSHATIRTATGDVEVSRADIVSEEKPAAK